MEKKKRKPLTKEEKASRRKLRIFSFIISLLISASVMFFRRNPIESVITFFAAFFIIAIYSYFRKKLKESSRIKRVEAVFPDFLQLMSSNLRAGMTVDRSMLLSSRPEFAPLDKEIQQAGRDIATGKNIELALKDMSKRIGSEKIDKTIILIISGIRAGGNLAVLLEETAVNMRERGFVEKKAASSVLMYVIFIFLSVSIFAPLLFALSTILVEVLTNILSGVPNIEGTVNLPFTLSKINVSVAFIKYFSFAFMIVIDVFAVLVLGLVSKGEEKQGLRFLPAILILSISVFFLSRVIISNFMSGLL